MLIVYLPEVFVRGSVGRRVGKNVRGVILKQCKSSENEQRISQVS